MRPWEDRFWEKVQRGAGCWEWQSTLVCGYGVFKHRVDGEWKSVKAHRLAYELTKGSIPAGLTLDHLCRNTKCVNPDHLEPVTCVDNVMRGNALPAVNARKTECKRGHALSGDNVYVAKTGYRTCKVCARQRPGKREYNRQYIVENRERLSQYRVAWRHANPDKVAAANERRKPKRRKGYTPT